MHNEEPLIKHCHSHCRFWCSRLFNFRID